MSLPLYEPISHVTRLEDAMERTLRLVKAVATWEARSLDTLCTCLEGAAPESVLARLAAPHNPRHEDRHPLLIIGDSYGYKGCNALARVAGYKGTSPGKGIKKALRDGSTVGTDKILRLSEALNMTPGDVMDFVYGDRTDYEPFLASNDHAGS